MKIPFNNKSNKKKKKINNINSKSESYQAEENNYLLKSVIY